jgi:hypothetical protein
VLTCIRKRIENWIELLEAEDRYGVPRTDAADCIGDGRHLTTSACLPFVRQFYKPSHQFLILRFQLVPFILEALKRSAGLAHLFRYFVHSEENKGDSLKSVVTVFHQPTCRGK